MCGVSRTLLHPGGWAIPASGRSPAQDGGPRGGVGASQNADSGDDVGFGMAPPPTSGFYKTRRNPPWRGCVCSVWVSSRGVFLLLDSTHVSPRRPAFSSLSPPTQPRFLLLDQASCLVPPTAPPSPSGLLPSPHKLLLFGTRSPHVWLWPEQRGYCRVPHHGASLPQNTQVLKAITSTPSLPGCKSPFFHWGFFFFCVCVCVSVLAPVEDLLLLLL